MQRLNRQALKDTALVFAVSRLLVLVVTTVSSLLLSEKLFNVHRYNVPKFTEPFSGAFDYLIEVWARWDSIQYLAIANQNYTKNISQEAFFPFYSLVTKIVSIPLELFLSQSGAVLLAAVLVSLSSFFGSMYLLHRLVSIELGEKYAKPVLWLLALSPMSLFFSTVYTEALFLFLTLGSFYSARQNRWLQAGLFAAAASATRNTGVLLFIPLILLYFWGPSIDQNYGLKSENDKSATWLQRLKPLHRPRLDVLWIGLVPLGLILYSVFLNSYTGDPLKFLHAQEHFNRAFQFFPLTIIDSAKEAWTGIRLLSSGNWPGPLDMWIANVEQFFLLLPILIATVGVVRSLPLPYSAYTVVALLVPLSYPASNNPLWSLPRFSLVLFPIFMWAGMYFVKRGWMRYVLPLSVALLIYYTAQWSLWYWVS